MPHISERIQSYVISENVRAMLDHHKYIVGFKKQIRKWAKNDLYFKVIIEHIKSGLEDHLQYLEVYPRFNHILQHHEWEHFADLMEHYQWINSFIRDLDVEFGDD